MSHKIEEQWEYQTTTKRGGSVYRQGQRYKYVDRGLESLDDLVEQINQTTAKITRIEDKIRTQGINL